MGIRRKILWISFIAIPISAVFAQTYQTRTVPGYPNVRTSAHFAVYWKDTSAYTLTNSAADSGLAALEAWWDFYVGQNRFPDPERNNAGKMRCAVFIITTGWAFGGPDAGHPALWLAPGAFRDDWALGHEYTHAMQAFAGGFVDNPYVGWVWESHANWMPHQRYPNNPHCAEAYPRMAELYYGSTRNRYCNWQFFEFMKEEWGYESVNRLWTDWPARSSPDFATEDLFRAIMRTRNLSFADFGDVWGKFALKMAKFDFKNGPVYRQAWETNRPEEWMRLQHAMLDPIDTALRRYSIPFDMAPQRYAYNVVRLYKESGADSVRIQFRGIVQTKSNIANWRKRYAFEPDTIPAPGSDWRWGIVLVNPAGPGFRYCGPFAGSAGQASVLPAGNESEMYLVVAATPKNRQLVMWDQMYYTLYRFPWMCQILGAWPEGFQPGAWAPPSGTAGANHPNGGGFVASTARVDATAYVGPRARVLDRAQVLDMARIEGQATVKGNAVVRDRAVVRGRTLVRGDAIVKDDALVDINASVTTGQVYERGQVTGSASIVNGGARIHGQAIVGGAAIPWDPCDISGSTRILGDAEIRNITATKGVFYGFVSQNEVNDTSFGANRTSPAAEVTAPPNYTWYDPVAANHLVTRSGESGLGMRQQGSRVRLDGIAGPIAELFLFNGNGRLVWRGSAQSKNRTALFQVKPYRGLGIIEARDGSRSRIVKTLLPAP